MMYLYIFGSIDSHEAHDLLCLNRQESKSILYRLDQFGEFAKVAIMRSLYFDFLPEELNWVLVWE
jgi:hypothetical protein